MVHVKTVQEFDDLIKKDLVLVDFFATWCGPCRMLSPILEEIEEENLFNGTIVKVDTDELGVIAARYGIQSIPTLFLFKDGQLEHQRVTNGSNDEFLVYKNIAKWMNERTILSNMLYITSTQLDSLFEGDVDFTVGFVRSSCSDCAYVEDHLLYEFNMKENNVSYLIDVDAFSNSDFKDKYGLTDESNPDYGYGEGYVPTFVRSAPAKTKSYSDAILDACVYLNDQIEMVNGEYKITKSFYKEERLPLLGFLGNPDSKYILEGKTIGEEQVDKKADGYSYSWNKKYSVPFHDETLKMFLDAYVSLPITSN